MLVPALAEDVTSINARTQYSGKSSFSATSMQLRDASTPRRFASLSLMGSVTSPTHIAGD